MADSDEEHDRSRNRDKFRRERSDYGDKPRSRADRRTWRDDHETGNRRRTREDFDDERDRRRHSSPGRGRDWSSPPHKRMRREPWDGFRPFPPDMMAPFGMRGPWMPPDMPGGMHHMPPRPGGHPNEPMAGPGLKKKTMLSFKQFLTQQDDNIDESLAIQLYQDYKSDFKRKQITEFFDEHKEEDWLISKYHPKHISARDEALKASLQDRVQAFCHLLESGRLDPVPLWTDFVDDIVNAMDAGVILMEGGSTHDLLSLVKQASDVSLKYDEREEQVEKVSRKDVKDNGADRSSDADGDVEKTSGDTVEKDRALFMEVSDEQRQLAQQARMYGEQMQAITDIKEGKKRRKKKKRAQADGDEYSYSGDKSDGSSEDSEAELNPDEPPPPGLEPAELETELQGDENTSEMESKPLPESLATNTDTPRNENTDPPRPLHITRSVYIRHLPPRISAEDIVEICRTIPGYLRIAFADPDPNRGYERRGWVTYSQNTDIREVIARLTTNKVKDIQLNCMVNRELTRRVKFGQEVAWASRAVHSDLHVTLNLAKTMDKKTGLWEHAVSDTMEMKTNPVLSISESLLSEEALCGNTTGEEEEGVVSDPGTEILSETDSKMKALDRLVWYLRVVHSVDYYNGMAFPSEDCMPHRCGIFTVRPSKPTAVTQDEVSSYIESTKSRIKPLLETKGEMSEDDMEKFGRKDPDAEVERFLEVNTQKLAENKYLCPLSGKKFKGPDFVRKHIFNKHSDKVDAVRHETEFFNNYLRDLDRPGQQETAVGAPSSASGSPAGIVHLEERQPISPGGQSTPGGWGQPPQMMFARGGFGPGIGGFPPGMMGGRGGFRSRGGRRGRGRRVINYHDLDAPEDMY